MSDSETEDVRKPTPQEFFKLVCSDEVKILVGPDEEEFSFPKDLLAYYSPYFKRCLRNAWKENTEGIIRLPKDDPVNFRIFGDFIRGIEPQNITVDLPNPIEYNERHTIWVKAAVSLILFADYFGIKQLLRVAFIMLETYHDDMDDNTGILDADTSITYKLATKVEMEDTDRCYSMLEPDSEITSIFATSCMLFCAITFGVQGALRNKVINLVKRNVNLSAAMMGKLVGHPQYLKEWHAVHLNDRLYQ